MDTNQFYVKHDGKEFILHKCAFIKGGEYIVNEFKVKRGSFRYLSCSNGVYIRPYDGFYDVVGLRQAFGKFIRKDNSVEAILDKKLEDLIIEVVQVINDTLNNSEIEKKNK